MAPSTTHTSSPSLSSSSSPPDVKNPNLVLRPATIPERHHTWVLNKHSWKGILTDNAYYLREAHIASQDLTRNGGITYWILVDPSTPCNPTCPQSPDHILSACEVIRKPCLIARKNGEVEEVICYGIGSVYTSERHRGKGYAKSMLQRLGRQLKSLPDPSNPEESLRVGFSVLYSDIGKEFYNRIGWRPHQSSHISFPSKLPTSVPSSKAKDVLKSDLKALCASDCAHIRRVVTKTPFAPDVEVRCVQFPTVEVMEWHHAREEFIGQYATSKVPTVKGAWISIQQGAEYPPKEGSDGSNAVWAIWTHDFAEKKLVFLRLHTPTVTSSNESTILDALKHVVIAAANEAEAWGFKEIISWNPDDITETAVKSVFGTEAGYDLVHREMDSIASLMWYDKDGSEETEPEGIEWCVNEKFAWC
ncbi:uncharacterized protein DFL_005881 [Arthrobotrys flagrans]|uniref:LYC1 C-terminal domain-containing protein n=1 Tax=Arthrobotrys flagrans TaxID=97331 RepID=A0A436ZZF2_ARTFL|nr:hypothetical protein DFL_005881 [Arthrobotrys flagrans]